MEKNNFITEIIEKDVVNGCEEIITRFPPNPNGFLHLGHAKSIHLNSSIATEFNGKFNLRLDDTNPSVEKLEYIDSIKTDLKWLGFNLEDRTYHASDYFLKMVEYAETLINKGLAYVCELSKEEWVEYRGAPTSPGKESPFRNRSVEDNLEEFRKMKHRFYKDGSKVLRAKIDMTSPNLHMRDPILYRIKTDTEHHRTKDSWCIYPTYDFAHCISDAIENISHSLCTLEFEVHRPLYDWILSNIDLKTDRAPKQTEFARLNLANTILSKRKLNELVEKGYVSGWDDPRMPTLSGMRRRGFTPKSIRTFLDNVGISKRETVIEYELLEHAVRDDLNETAERRFAILDPLKLVVLNLDDRTAIETKAVNNPQDESAGTRDMFFSRNLWIEREDFREEANRKYNRLAPGRFVRLKYGFIVECVGCEKDEDGNITEVHCNYVPESKSGEDTSGIKPKGTIHWLSSANTRDVEIRMYGKLFNDEEPAKSDNFLDSYNKDSLKVIHGLFEYDLATAINSEPGTTFQFERVGYFCVDSGCDKTEPFVFNSVVDLKGKWKG